MRTFYFIGLKRSGQHAIIEWIANHFNGPVPLTNNCIAWPPISKRVSHVFHVDDLDEVWEMRQSRQQIPCEAQIITREDPYRRPHDLYIEGGTNVWCLRSFWNNAASRMNVNGSPEWDDRFPEWWLRFSNEIVECDVPILYDEWCVNRDVHRLMLGLEYNEKAEELSKNVSHKGYCGNIGSSFYGWRKLGEPGRRWELMQHDKRFKHLVQTADECREANFQIFGWTLSKTGEYVC